MIYEWYTGSDPTLQVAKAIAELEYGPPDSPLAQRMDILARALDLEEERNWRGVLHAKVARELRSDGQDDEALPSLLLAEQAFDPLAATFMAVVDEYAWVLYILIKDHHLPAANHVAIIEAGTRLLSVLDLADFTRWEQFMSLAIVGRAMRFLGEQREDRLLLSIALPLVVRAHHLFPEHESKLEDLVYLYHHLGRLAESAHALALLEQVGTTEEVLERTREFARLNSIVAPGSRGAM